MFGNLNTTKLEDEHWNGGGSNVMIEDRETESHQEEETLKEQQVVEVWGNASQCYMCGAMANGLNTMKRNREGEDSTFVTPGGLAQGRDRRTGLLTWPS